MKKISVSAWGGGKSACVASWLRPLVMAIGMGGAAVVASAAPVTTVIAEDSFAYAGGIPITGQNGGSGWTSAWLSDSAAFPDSSTDAAGLSMPGATGSGGKLKYVFFGSQINDAARTLPLQNGGVVFVQLLAQFGVQSGAGTPSIRFSAA